MRDLWGIIGALVLVVIVAGTAASVPAQLVAPGRPAPELAPGAWINSEPLTMQALRGRVLLVEFWTYG